jgi:dienelactone hydrolase
VVLLAGSGPLDRDETIGRNKPLKDIAWGLVTRGIAVIRFDKVTYAHPGELSQADAVTLNDEYLPHARAALGLLREEPTVDARRIFLLGHSLGGTVAPRIAAAEPEVAGLIILAGGAAPLHWVIVRQTRYLASLNPASEPQARAAIEALAEKARAVDSPALTASTPADQLPLGVPASYWLDLRGYNPAQIAAELHTPMLILQGGRDYQSTVEDDLARWKAALEGRPEVTIRVYPDHNHLFTPGAGPPSPAEYEPAQHVDGDVINDIATWVNRR